MVKTYDDPELKYAYQQGYKSIMEGPNKENCNISLFVTRELTNAWQHGRKTALYEKGLR